MSGALFNGLARVIRGDEDSEVDAPGADGFAVLVSEEAGELMKVGEVADGRLRLFRLLSQTGARALITGTPPPVSQMADWQALGSTGCYAVLLAPYESNSKLRARLATSFRQ